MNLRQNPAEFPMHGRQDAAAEDLPAIDLGEIIRLARSHKFTILGTAALFVAITALVLANLTPIYTATAYVILDQRPNAVVDATAVMSGLPTDPNSIETQVQVLQSRNLAGRVVDKLMLENDSSFNAPPAPPAGLAAWLQWLKPDVAEDGTPERTLSERDAIINRLLAKLTITAQGRSASIAIKFQGPDPVKAALAANAFAEAYV